MAYPDTTQMSQSYPNPYYVGTLVKEVKGGTSVVNVGQFSMPFEITITRK